MSERARRLDELIRLTDSLLGILEHGVPDQLDTLVARRQSVVDDLLASPSPSVDEASALKPRLDRLRLLDALLEQRARDLQGRADEALQQLQQFQGQWGKLLQSETPPAASEIDQRV